MEMITPLEEWIATKIGMTLTGLNRAEIESHQLEKLRQTVRWAREKSLFYGKHLGDLTEKDLTCLEDLVRFPFTTPAHIQENPLRFLCVSQGEVSRVVTLETSGTTGNPKRIWFTAEDQEATIDYFHHGMSTLAGPGDRVLILLPGERSGSVGDLLMKALSRLGAAGMPHGFVLNPLDTLQVMRRERPDVLVGTPVQVLSLARNSEGDCAPRSVLLSTDHVPKSLAKGLERIWGCEVFTHYGMTEMGFGGGLECRAHSGYHLREVDLYVEVVDPKTCDPLPDGIVGEVVFTTLVRRGMPLIRYRTGDLSRFLSEPCPCGTVLRTLEGVTTRIDSRIALFDGAILTMADMDEALFEIDDLLDFSATLSREGDRQRLGVELFMREGAASSAAGLAESKLRGIPSIHSAEMAEKLALAVSVGSAQSMVRQGNAKRRIRNMKGEGVQ
ncbi:MAG: phenylacetate--CoA ligase family protein [Syntrophobacteraceae bacterium]|nr:phenylacetate--CoA ligase family protein [Syntrophobacteraceae bacterium]